MAFSMGRMNKKKVLEAYNIVMDALDDKEYAKWYEKNYEDIQKQFEDADGPDLMNDMIDILSLYKFLGGE